MPLESATYISQLVASDPVHGDGLNNADGHLRLIKSVLQAQFPNFTAAALNSTNSQIDTAVSATLGTAVLKMIAGTAGAPGLATVGDATTGLFSPGTGKIAIATSGVNALEVDGDQSVNAKAALNVTGAATLSSTLAVTGAYSGGTGQLLPVGAPIAWLSNTLPSGNYIWLNGQAISRSGNPTLFTMWSTTYGTGNGTTTFNVPNLQECVLVGRGTMGGASDPGLVTNSGITTLGSIIGEGKHTLTTSEAPSGLFTLTDPGHSHAINNNTAGNGSAGNVGIPTVSNVNASFTVPAHTTGITLNDNGGNTAHNNVQPSFVVNWICLAG